jgi:ankyrin repeat protein
MTNLPARPDIDQLRHQARDLLRDARSGDQAAAARIGAVADSMTLAAAQLAVAREYGFASWPRLKAEVDARSSDLAGQVDAFLEASMRDWTGRAARMLAATPQIAGYDFRTAVVLGDGGQVRQMLEHDPGLAIRPDPRWGWTALHAVCASRWHRLDPARADGLLAVAGLLLDAGADPAARTAGRQGDWTPLRCAVAGTANPAIARLLLERGATPDDHDLYLACFDDDDHQSLRLLLDHAHDMQHTTALAAPISTGDTEAVRLLLQAGADPSRPLPGDLFGERVLAEPPIPAVAAAAQSGCPAELVGLLLDAGADPDAPAQDGHSPYRIAIRQGRTDVADLLAQHGARDHTTSADRFLLACRQSDRAGAERLLRASPDLPGLLGSEGQAALVDAAGHGQAAAVRLMLDAGFPLEARGQDGATALHAAAGSGSAEVVRLLLDRGADIEACDTTWDSTPLNWAQVGSGLGHVDNPAPDWTATIRALIEAGASTADITLSPDDPKPPSPEVAQLLRSYGIGSGPAASHG